MHKILVMLAAYNGGPWIASQVDSILVQRKVQLRLLVGDDCSSDGAVDELKSADVERIEILRFSVPSGGAGQNFIRIFGGAALEPFEYVALSDQDDLWYPDKLARAICILQSRGADGYSSAVTAFWPDGREQVLCQNSALTDLDFLFEGAGQGCTFVLRGDFARQVQGILRSSPLNLSAVHYHDWLIYAISRALGKQWVFDPEPSMLYRQHTGNDTGARARLAGMKKRLGLIRNGWYANQVRQMIAVVSSLNDRAIPSDFLAAWNCPEGARRRLWLARILLARSRRRASDRLALAVFSLLGWL